MRLAHAEIKRCLRVAGKACDPDAVCERLPKAGAAQDVVTTCCADEDRARVIHIENTGL